MAPRRANEAIAVPYASNKPMVRIAAACRDERHDTVLELFPAEPRDAACRWWEGWTRTPRDCCSSTDDGAQPCADDESEPPCRKEYEVVGIGATGSGCSLAF